MSVQTREAPALRRRLVSKRWSVLVLAAVLVAGMGVSVYRVVRSSSDGAPVNRGTSAAELSEIYGSQSVTGTGPGLIQVAEESQVAEITAVTGTGPGLVWVAQQSGAAALPAVTGTGPGLIQVAEESRSA